MKAMPQYEEMKRRARKKEREAAKAAARAEEEATQAKRQKIDIADDEVSYLKRLSAKILQFINESDYFKNPKFRRFFL